MEVAFPGGLSVPEGQVPFPLSTLASALPLEQGTIGLNHFAIGQIFRIFAEAMEGQGR